MTMELKEKQGQQVFKSLTSCEKKYISSQCHTQENEERKMKTFKRSEEEEEEPFFFEEQKDYRSLPEPLMF